MDNEQLQQAVANGSNARPNELRSMQSILNSGMQEQTKSYIEGASSILNRDVNRELNTFLTTIKELNTVANSLSKSTKQEEQLRGQQIKTTIKTLDLEKQLQNAVKNLANTQADAERITSKGHARNAEDLADASKSLTDLVDTITLCDSVLDDLKSSAGGTSKALETINQRGQYIKQQQGQEARTKRDNAELLKKLEKILGGSSMDKSVAKEWSNIGSSLRSIINTLNINQIAQQFAPSSRQQLQADLQTNYNISAKEFQDFKKGLFDQVDQSIYTSEDIIAAMGTLSSSTLENTATATKYFEDLVRGQKVLGLSSQTQETLLKLNNITGRNELKFYTNQVAKYQQSSLGLNKRQLDELVNLNANLQSQAADIGIATTEFRQMSANEQAALESTNAGYGSKYAQALSNALVNTESTAAMLGMDSGELAERLSRGESFIDMLRRGPGTQVALQALQSGDQAYISRIKENAMGALGIDENTWTILRVIAQQETELNKNLRTATNASKEQKDAAAEQEEKYGESLTIFQKTVNGISNWFNSNVNWTELEYIRSIDSVVKTIAVLLGAKDIFSGLGNIFGGGKGAGLLSKVGIKTGVGGAKGISGLKVGAASGWGAVGALGSTAAGIGLGIYDGFQTSSWRGGALRGAFLGTGNAQQTTEEKMISAGGNGVKGMLIGAGIGTALGGPLIGTAIGGLVGVLLGGIGTMIDKEKELSKEEQERLDEIEKNTYTTAQNTSYQGIGMVYRYRGKSNWSSATGSATNAGAMGDASNVGYPVSSSYGSRGIIYTSAGPTQSFHNGMDFAAPEGTPLYSNVTGTVIGSGTMSDGANYIAVRDDNTGYTHWYAHMQKQSPLKKGQHVNQGEFVGYVGHTGKATGPHLHYSVTKPGAGNYLNEKVSVNPYNFASASIFSGKAAPASSAAILDNSAIALNSVLSTPKTSIALSSLGDIATPIVGSINDLKQTIIDLSDRTSRNEKIMNALVNRTMQSPTV